MKSKTARSAILFLFLALAFTAGYGVRWWTLPSGEESSAEGIASARAASEATGSDAETPRRPARARRAESPSASVAASEELRAIPYLQGYQRAGAASAVTVYESGKAAAGLNFYVSGHDAEAVLMDMEGKPLHRWRHPLGRVWPELRKLERFSELDYWRRAYLYPNGDLLAIFETVGLVKLDRDSNLLWTYRSDVHHDLFVDPEGDIWVLDRRQGLVPRMHREKRILEDLVTVLDPSGQVRRQFSILEAFEKSPYRPLVASRSVRHGDIFHTNTLGRLDGKLAHLGEAFGDGNLLISVLQLNTVAILDPRKEKIVWALSGLWRKQHQPEFLANGHLLVFDNLGPGGRRSRVVEIDPTTQRFVWSYGGTKAQQLHSRTLGTSQRLANGNTLITESEAGRALEVSPEGQVVWEFINPHRAGREGELVATLFELVRLPIDFPFQGSDRSRS
ncbi:MAG: arylsulfotransferase family protein [Deltaproteobacteria bacterium]|nr:arylsulfotransferase family protein [Deltaproteobacteria bacterium]